MAFLIVHDAKASAVSLGALKESLDKSSGVAIKLYNPEKDDKKTPLGRLVKSDTSVVLFVSKKTLLSLEITRFLNKALSKTKKFCVLYEGDKSEGALYSKTDLQKVDLDSLFSNPKMSKQAKSILKSKTFEIKPMMFRKHPTFSDFTAKLILHTLCLNNFNLFLSSAPSLPSTRDPDSNTLTISHNITSSVRFCIEDLSVQILTQFPKSTRNFVDIFDAKLSKCVNELILSPLKMVKPSSKVVFVISVMHELDRQDADEFSEFTWLLMNAETHPNFKFQFNMRPNQTLPLINLDFTADVLSVCVPLALCRSAIHVSVLQAVSNIDSHSIQAMTQLQTHNDMVSFTEPALKAHFSTLRPEKSVQTHANLFQAMLDTQLLQGLLFHASFLDSSKLLTCLNDLSLIEQMIQSYGLDAFVFELGKKQQGVEYFVKFMKQMRSILFVDVDEFCAQFVGYYLLNKEDMFEGLFRSCESRVKSKKSGLLPVSMYRAERSEAVDLSGVAFSKIFPDVCCVKQVEGRSVLGTKSGVLVLMDAAESEVIGYSSVFAMEIVWMDVFQVGETQFVLSLCVNGSFNVSKVSDKGFEPVFKSTDEGNRKSTLVSGCFVKNTSQLVIAEAYRLDVYDFVPIAVKHNRTIQFPSDSRITAMSVLQEDKVVLGFEDGRLKVQSLDAKPIISMKSVHKRSITALQVHQGYLLSAGFDRKLVLWDLADLSLVDIFKTSEAPIEQFSVSGNALSSISTISPELSKWTFENNKLTRTSFPISNTSNAPISHCLLSPTQCLSFLQNYTLTLTNLNFPTESDSNTLLTHSDWVTHVANNKRFGEFATGSLDGSILVYDVETGEVKRKLECEGYAGNLFVFSRDGKYVLSRIGAWDAETGVKADYLQIAKGVRTELKEDVEMRGLEGYEGVTEVEDGGRFTGTHRFGEQTMRKALELDGEGEVVVYTSGAAMNLLKLSA